MTWGRGAGYILLIGTMAALLAGISESLCAPVAHASSKAERQEGAVMFHEKGCEHCHGVDGAGTERGPDLSGVGRQMHKPEIERQIRNGGKQMPAFGDTLTGDEVQQLVAYLAAKKKKVARPAMQDSFGSGEKS